jgi:hypothetical protein
MAPGGRVGSQLGKLFLHVLIEENIISLLLKNQWARKAEIYVKAF